RKLEALARAFLPVLLAFFHTGIARQKTILSQRRPQLRIEARNRSRQSHAYRTSLPTNSATSRRDHYIDLLGQASKLQRLGGVVLPREIRKVLLDRPAVHREFAGTCAHNHSRDRFLAAAGAEKPICARDGRTRRTQRSSYERQPQPRGENSRSVYPPRRVLAPGPVYSPFVRKAPQRAENFLR